MMRGMTILWAVLALAVGSGLFLLKYEVHSLEDRLASLNGQIRSNQSAIHVLKAEWSYLNDPERLRQLNERHLAMKPFRSEQIVSIADLPLAQPPASEPQPEEPSGRIMVDAPAAPAAPKPAQAQRKPADPAPPRETREARAPAPAPAPVPAPIPAAAAKPAAPAPAPVVVAKPQPAPLPAPIPATVPATVVRPAAALPAAGGEVLVIKSPALLEAERRQAR